MKIVFVIGGARSGKSSFALREAGRQKGSKAYIATAEELDDEMRGRIARHKADRGPEWDVYEEPLDIAGALEKAGAGHGVIVIDCLTLWLSNVMLRAEGKEQGDTGVFVRALEKIKGLSVVQHQSLYIVSNEVGMGIVPENELARKFRDLAGMLNQKVADLADEVYLVTAGIPVKIKG